MHVPGWFLSITPWSDGLKVDRAATEKLGRCLYDRPCPCDGWTSPEGPVVVARRLRKPALLS